jgi:hypothetical protein
LPSIVEALAECLEAMREGEEPAACLETYPQYRAELAPLLEIASLIRPLAPEVVPSPEFREQTRERLPKGPDDWEEISFAPD